ncbi:MAG: hypothetical protein ACOCV2_04735, partial [Persicimonas sp.]
MKSYQCCENRSAGTALGVLTAVAFALLLAPSQVSAQDEPTSSVEKPYIMLLMDTSASMEWTDEGDEEYPNNSGSEAGTNEWKSGKEIFPRNGDDRYGPCYIWRPDCDDYSRPAWAPDEEDWSEAYEDDSDMKDRLEEMRSNTTHRLKNTSQPRHVTLKEILSGEMILLGEDNQGAAPDEQDPDQYPPGCWFVPRQHDATSQGRNVCDGEDDFEDLPDFDEPRPHFQEVFDGQRQSGLMDTLGGNAIFALAMFDGYKQSKQEPESGWEGSGKAKDLDDGMEKGFAGIREGEGDSEKNDPDKEKEYNYNLGVFQMVSPDDLDMSSRIARDVSNFVQTALVDAGFLSDEKPELKPKDDEGAGAFDDTETDSEGGVASMEFSDRLDKYLDDYTLGRQPIARATPLAAAMYDIHHFFAEGPEGKEAKDSPLVEDPYKKCRPKHVVMITDGHPEPELTEDDEGDDVGEQVGGDTLTSAYGYERDRYPYTYTEAAIDNFVVDRAYRSGETRPAAGSEKSYLADDWDTETGARFNPRVHIVGLKNGEPGDGEDEEFERQVVAKTAAMAVNGKTCAGEYLGEEWLPSDNGDGTCDLDERFCLDPRQPEFMANSDDFNEQDGGYRYQRTDGTTTSCKYPALLLTTRADQTSDPDSLANPVRATNTALQLLFNNILSEGVASRTRPTFVNRLDDAAAERGGQYRYFSGLSIDRAEVFWRGLLYR